MLFRILRRLPVPERLARVQKALSVLLSLAVALVAQYFPGFGIDPEIAYLAAFGLAFVLVYLVPNVVAGWPVDILARAIVEADAETKADAVAQAKARARTYRPPGRRDPAPRTEGLE